MEGILRKSFNRQEKLRQQVLKGDIKNFGVALFAGCAAQGNFRPYSVAWSLETITDADAAAQSVRAVGARQPMGLGKIVMQQGLPFEVQSP